MGTSASAERRESTRKRFSGTVELALPDEAEGYEADAVDLSIGGMSLKTAFLPDVGSELDCRFVLDGSDARTVQARGQVVWAKDNGNDAGTFGLCFTDVSKGDRAALENHCEPKAAAKNATAAPARSASVEPARSAVDPHARTVNAPMAAPAPADDRVRLRLPKMGEPLKARVHQEADGALVVGMDLSFIALGDHVEVESAKGKSKGVLEDVAVDVDPKTRGARLVLTVSLDGSTAASRTGKHSAIVAPAASAARPAPAAKEEPRVAKKPAPVMAEDSSDTDHDTHNEPAPRGTGTEVLSSREGAARAQAVKSASESEGESEGESSLASRSSAPAWLVSALARVKIQGRAAWDKASPAAQKAFAALVTLAMTFSAKVRAKLTGKPVELPAPTTAATRATTAKAATAPARPALRKQKGSSEAPAVEASAIDSTAPSMRRKYAMIGLGAFGLSAIVFALATGGREQRPQAPRPQVAVEASGATVAPTNSTAQANPSASEPVAAGAAATGEPESNAAIEPSAPSAQPVARPGAMPSDLVAAARSRNANVDSEQPTVRREAPALTIAPRAARPAPAAPALAAAGNVRPLGSPAVRSGTTLRLRVDGPITQLSGGAAGPNTLTFTMPGRHALDRAAAFVRMDPRIAGAGAFNRGGNTEFTLRFHGAAPAFNARARGDVLEVVLAAPSASATAAAAPRPSAHGVRVASMPRR